MNEDIKVDVVKFQDRDNFVMKYTDPITHRPENGNLGG